MRKYRQLILASLLAGVGSFFSACDSDPINVEISSVVDDMALEGFDVESIDSSAHVINVTPNGKNGDTLYFDNLNIPEGSSAYLAANDDLIDPEIDWDSPVTSGSGVTLGEDGSLVLVVLDEDNRVFEVWRVKVDEGSSSSAKSKSSSSSKKKSSDSKDASSSGSKNVSSASLKESSASESSCSGKEEGSASEKKSSSSVKENSSNSKPNSSSDKKKELSSSSQAKAPVSESSSSGTPAAPESSSSLVKSSSDVVEIGDDELVGPIVIPDLSSDKFIERIVVSVNGAKRSDLVADASAKTIDLGLIDGTALNSIQVFSIYVAEGAEASVPVKNNLTLVKISEEETVVEVSARYGYDFTVTAEDGSFDVWTIAATVITKKGYLLSDFGVATNDSSITVTDNRIYVEVPYGTDLTRMTVFPMDSVVDLSSEVQMDFIDDGIKKTYTVKAGMQLPGSNFNAWDKNFWGSSTEAMSTEATSEGCFLVFDVKVKSSANLEFSGSKATLTTRIVEASSIGINGGWKAAGGFYFAGNYTGSNALELYEEGRTSGCPLEDAVVDMRSMMNLGKPFTGRPVSFSVDYSYVHVKSDNSKYPQKSLIYVMLVSSDNKLVASGAIVDNASVENASTTVDLVYGGDSFGLLSSGYPVASGIDAGNGDEPVASIHVMFASSAYAHVVAGGIAGNDDEYRGGENSKLVLDNFKLNY